MTLDAIRARHVPIIDADPGGEGERICEFCAQLWGDTGCDTAVTLAALDGRDEWLEQDAINVNTDLRMLLAAAEAREARLREALVTAHLWAHPYLTPSDSTFCIVCGESGSYGHSEPDVMRELRLTSPEAEP